MSEPETDVQRFAHGCDAVALMTQFATKACRNITIFSHALSSDLYCEPALVDAISTLARKSAASKVQILLRDSRPLYGVDHALINLCRRLPSHVSVRVLREDTAPANIAYFCVDDCGLVFFNDEASFHGFARAQARAEAKHWLDAFASLWQTQSKADPNLRLLAL